MKKIVEYLKEKQKSTKNLSISKYISNIIIVEPFVNPNIDLSRCISYIEQIVPRSLLMNIDVIYIGDFEPLNVRQVQSLFENGLIYLSNKIESEKELILSLIHETAHAFEEINGDFIYDNGEIEQEFLAKRLTLFNILKSHNFDPPTEYFKISRFIPEFDHYLNNIVGYKTLENMSNGLFLSPYGITSLREYFANAFEKFFSGQPHLVKNISPAIYRKLADIE